MKVYHGLLLRETEINSHLRCNIAAPVCLHGMMLRHNDIIVLSYLTYYLCIGLILIKLTALCVWGGGDGVGHGRDEKCIQDLGQET
jgi:hypothetical protein